MIQEQKDSTKNESKSKKVIDQVLGKKDKKAQAAQIDSDLASEEDSNEDESQQEYDSEEGELEEQGEEEDDNSEIKSDSEPQKSPKGKVKLRQMIDSCDEDSDDDKKSLDAESGEIDVMDAGYGSEDDEEMEEMIYDSEDEDAEFEHEEDLSDDNELLSDDSDGDSFEDRHGVPRFEEVTSEDLKKEQKSKNKK